MTPRTRARRVFFRRSQPRPVRGDAPDRDLIDDMTHDAVAQRGAHLDEWRRSAQRVTRAWNSWLAADRSDRDAGYDAFVSALADEEQAAAKAEGMIQSTDTSQGGTSSRC